jgi:phage/plasmid-associated DNA primase
MSRSRSQGPGILTEVQLNAMTDKDFDRLEARRPTFSTVAAPMVSPTSEEGLALSYATRHAGELRYVASWSRWLKWDGCRWAFENTLAAFDLARTLCRETAAKSNKQKDGRRLLDARTVASVEKLAKADRRLAATVEQWESDPWIFNKEMKNAHR